MVMLPTQLERLISGLAPDEMVEKLRQEDCLSARGQERPDEVVALIRQTMDSYAPFPDGIEAPGPSLSNHITLALATSPFLNEKGKHLNRLPW